MELLQIILLTSFGLLGFFLTISSEHKRKKRFWFGMTAILMSMGILVSQIVVLNKNAREKQAEQQEFLRLKYSFVLDDDKILKSIKNTPINEILNVHISPLNSTIGQRAKVRWIMLPCPKTLINMYKVIDPSNYGFQGITPLFPVISNKDNQKYYIGGIAVSETQFSPDNKIIVVTKHKNGLLEVENITIEQYILPMHGSEHPISDIIFTPIDE